MTFNKKQVGYLILLFAACFAIYSYWSTGATILSTIYSASLPFLAGAGIAYIVNIVMSLYEKLFMILFKKTGLIKIKRAVSLVLAYLTFIALIIWIFSIVLPDLISSITSLMSIDTSQITDFINYLSENSLVKQLLAYFGSNSDLTSTLTSYGQQVLSQVLSFLTSLLTSVTSIASTVINVFVSLVFSMYVLAGKEKLGRQFNLLIDTYLGKYAYKIHYVVGVLHKRFHGFFVSQTLEAIILGSLTALGMTLLSLPYATTIGVLIAFTALIPVVGAYIGLAIGFILIATQSVTSAFIFVIYLILLQQFEGNVIYPRVVGGYIELPGMWVLMAITIGGALWGILGMLVAVPLAASLYQMLKDNVAKRQLLALESEEAALAKQEENIKK